MVTSEAHRRIAEALSAGLELDEIEEAIIDPLQLDEEAKSALWLYAEALHGWPLLVERELVAPGA
jgi:hypothetical protein